MSTGIEYYTVPFHDLYRILGRRIKTVLHESPARVRAKFLLECPIDVSSTDALHKWMFSFTGVIETEFQKILSRHSIFFWIHLYRRISPELFTIDGDENDPHTVALVRNITETAILKYGRFELADMKLSHQVAPERVMGGHFIRSIKRHLGDREAQLLIESLRAQAQWVLFRFESQDLVDIYGVEGLAYEYWRATAALRAIGKGARLRVENGNWIYDWDPELGWLIDRYDERIAGQPLQSTLLGTWFGSDANDLTKSETLVALQYNARREEFDDGLRKRAHERAGISVERWIPNFQIGLIDIDRFYDSVSFLEEPFAHKHGLSLRALLRVCAVLGSMLLLERLDDVSVQSFWKGLLNACNRAYRTHNMALDELVLQISATVSKKLGAVAPVSEEEIKNSILFLTLSPAKQNDVCIWSGGPRYLLIPQSATSLIDFQGLGGFLHTITVGLPQQIPEKGESFEQSVREHFIAKGYSVRSGQLIAASGRDREVDLLIEVGETALVCDCHSVFRPLDYEIGNPITFQRRQDRMTAKLNQNASLIDFLKRDKIGRNYDFSAIKNFVGVIISPFVEWLWSRGDELWIDGGDTPRIMTVNEALTYLERLKKAA